MKIINLSELINNKFAYFREDISKLNSILDESENEICVDFKEIEIMSPSSAHELICIIKDNSNLRLINLSEKLTRIINSQIKLRNTKIKLV